MSMPGLSVEEEATTETHPGIQLAHDADLLIRTYVPSSLSLNQPYTGPPIPLPLCIPQVGVSPDEHSTFARGYNEVLNDTGIPQDVLLNFIDGLNMAIIASPPLRVVGTVGKVIGFIPHHWAMIAGAIINTAAGVAIHVLAKTLTDRYLRAANLNLFKPRGLSVRICTTSAMLALLDSSESKLSSKLNKFGRGVGSVFLKIPLPVVNPIASTIIHAISDKPPAISPSGREGDPIKNSVLRRRVAMTEGFALSLNIDDIPPPVKPDGVMDTMASWGVRFDTAIEKFSEKNNERRRRALQSIREANIEQPSSSMRLLETGSPTSSSASLPRPPSNTGRSGISSTSSTGFKNMASSALNTVNDWRLQREVYFEQQNTVLRNSRLGNVGLLGHKKSRMEQKVADADLLEHWGTEKILWVVIMASDKGTVIPFDLVMPQSLALIYSSLVLFHIDEEIENIGIAEDPADEEQIDDRTWRERMAVERDEMELEDLQKLQQQPEETHASVHAGEGNS
ncbi:hypothetical protein F5051DRAFT_455444 [Lentinula edodes]|nr:hypothetical protein F5051DRAFT_455444 [Lentinula edodes]